MTFRLKKIELSNIRSHRYVTFEPEGVGVTAISGANGAGKSTLVDSVAWCLWGTKPSGVSKAAAIMREGMDFDQEKAFGRVYLEIDQSILKVERRFVHRQGAVECDVWEKKHGTDENAPFEHVAGPAVSHTETYLKQRLKMDEKGFLAAVLVQQKQVDQLISAGAKERSDVIERLTGIASISKGLEKARNNYNVIRKAFQHAEVDEGAKERFEGELQEARSNLKKKEALLLRLQGRKAEAQEQESTLSATLEEEETKASEAERLNLILVEAATRLSSLQEDFEATEKLKEVKRAAVSALAAGTDLEEVSRKLQELRSTLRGKEVAVDRLEEHRQALRSSLEAFTAVVEAAAKSSLDEEGARRRLETTRASLEKLATHRAKSRDEVAEAQGSMKKLASAAKTLEKGDGACPTCLQKVADPAEAVASLKTERQAQETLKTQAEEALKTCDIQEEKLRKQEFSLSSLLEAIEGRAPLEIEERKVTQEITQLQGDAKALELEILAQERIYAAAAREEEVKQEYQEVLDRLVAISDRQEALQGKQQDAEAALKALGRISGGLPALRTRATKAKETLHRLTLEEAEVRSDQALLTQRIAHLEESLARAVEEIEKYQGMMANVEAAGKNVELLEEFRQHRVGNSVPVVSAYASDFLSRFTDGKFIALTLDKKFNASVTLADGAVRPVGLLSGGELSSASISLRLAISMLLNAGPSQNVLILDEVLVSQDAARSEQILGTIKEVCQGQVIIISHGPNTNAIADQVFEL